MPTKSILDLSDKYFKTLMVVLGVFLALTAGLIDVYTGNSMFFASLYLLPILLIAWFVGGVSVAFISSLCGITWLAADVTSGHIYSHIATTIWESFMVLSLFLIVGYSIAALKNILLE